MLKQPATQHRFSIKTMHKVNQKEPAAMIRQALQITNLFYAAINHPAAALP